MRAVDPWAVPIRCTENHGDAVHVDAALLWTTQPRVDVRGYVNQTPVAGVHLDALRWAVVAAMRHLDDRLFRVHPPALFEVAAEGLVAAVHVELADPKLDQGRDLINREAATACLDTVTTGLTDALADDHALRDRLLSRIPR
jgi:DNA gyrase/topoisomerase IV subunit B